MPNVHYDVKHHFLAAYELHFCMVHCALSVLVFSNDCNTIINGTAGCFHANHLGLLMDTANGKHCCPHCVKAAMAIMQLLKVVANTMNTVLACYI